MLGTPGPGRPAASELHTARRLTGAARAALVTAIGALLALPAPAQDQDADAGLSATPLASRSTSAGPRFVRMDAEATGIDFVHAFHPDAKYLHMLGNATAGGGVALGDTDADGLPDVFLTRPHGGGRLYRNLGDFRFEDVTEAAGLADDGWSGGAAFADVDGDRDLDLFVCGYDTPSRLWINQGDGTFREGAAAARLDYTGAPIMMSFMDHDADGDVDGYLTTNHYAIPELADLPVPYQANAKHHPEGDAPLFEVRDEGSEVDGQRAEKDILFRNNGDGTFTDITFAAGMYGNNYGLSATWWDADGDGRPDLYVANDYFGSDRLYKNRGDGRFDNVIKDAFPHTPWYSMGSDAGDLDNDGRMDFIASDMSSDNHYRQKLTMGDMGGVGARFLVSAVPRQYMRNAVFRNTGTERFQEVGFLTGLDSTNWTWAPKLGDLDDDGRLDLFVTNGMTRDFFNSDLRQEGRQHDAYMDEFWVHQEPLHEANLAYRNLGDLRFDSVGPEWGLAQQSTSFGAALGDLDGDGDLDLVVNDFEGPVGIYRNRTADGHRLVVRLVGTASNAYGLGATVRVETRDGPQVRFLAPARGFMGSNQPIAHFGLGDVATVDRLVVTWPSGHEQVYEDVAADMACTITEPASAPPARRAPTPPVARFASWPGPKLTERPYDDYEREPLLPYKLSQMGPGLAVADMDADGADDFYLGGPAGQHGGLFRTSGGKGFWFDAQESLAADNLHEDMGALFLDFDRDGDLDLYVVSGSNEWEPDDALLADRLYVNRGDGTLDRAPEGVLPELRDSGSAVCAADFDRDGDLDLFVGSRSVPGEYPAIPDSRLLRNDVTRFTEVTDAVAPGLRSTGLVTTATWTDTDGDGWTDLVVAHEWGPIKVWRNEEGTLVDRTLEANLADSKGWWTGLAAGDVDNDGDVDLVAGNVGLNTKYHASRERPMLIYYGDYDGTGERHLVEAEWEGGTLYPVRGKSCSTNAMPFLGEKFETFDSFASASLTDIYGAECLEDADRREMTELRSGVWINDGRGWFDFRPLPRLAQVAPAYGMVLAELDGDGALDLVLAQNFYSTQPETGHMDGGVGQLLLGDGDGTFTPVDPADSGIVVPGDAKGLVTAELDGNGWIDVMFGVNDGNLQGYLNMPAGGTNVMQPIQLRYHLGNPTAVGARVVATLSDGSLRTAEVSAGGSYMSQSTSRVTFGLGPTAHVETLDVTWPDGRTTVHELPPEARGRGLVIRPE